MAIEKNYINPVNGERTVTPVENPVCVYTSYLGGSDVISSDEMNSYKTAKLVNPLGDRISLSLPNDSRQTAPDATFPLYDDTRTYGFNSATLMTADPADELSFLSYALTVKDRNGVRAFTDIDFKRCLLSGSISYDEVDGKKRYSVCETFTLKYAYGEKTSFLDTNGSIDDVEPSILFTKDNGYYGLELRSMRVSCYYTELTYEKNSNLGSNTIDFGYGTSLSRTERRAIWKAYERGMYPYDGYTEHQTIENMTYSIFHGGGSGGNNTHVDGYINNEHDALLLIAGVGLAFEVDGVIYKPIVQGGTVVDFTSDMDEKSEWDEWTDFGSRTLPDAPGGGGGGEDHDNGDWKLDYLSNVSVGGTVRYYLMTSAELLALNEAFDSARIGFNPLQSIISVMQVAVPQQTLGLAVRAVQSIYFRSWTISEGQDSGWTAPVATHMLRTQRMNVSIGNIKVPKLTGTFLDYEPYGSVEAYIPFCGWMKLPSKLVVGHTVTFSMSYDIRTCSCIVTAWCNGANIGQITGSIGTEIPMSTNGASIKKAALIQSSVDMISGTAMSTSGAVLGALSGSTPLMTAGMINTGASLIGGITQMALTNSQNFSMSIGNTGDNSRFYGGGRVVVRCVSGNFMIPDGFGDSTGYLVMKRMSLSNLKGFTVVDDPKIDVACTDVERDMLREMLVSGIVIR